MKWLCSRLFTLIVMCIFWAACSNVPTPDNSNRTNTSTNALSQEPGDGETEFGEVAGIAYDCERTPLSHARLSLIKMPDSVLADTSHYIYPLRFFHDTSFYWGTEADSAGNFVFSNVPVGSYQIVLGWGERPAGQPSYLCISSALERVEVIADSVAVVNISQLNGVIEVVHTVMVWKSSYRPMH